MIKAKIIGTGSYLPNKKETVSDFLAKGASQELIDKLGVFEHRVIANNQTVTDMEVEAAKRAIENAGIAVEDIDLIISGSAIPRQIGVPNSNAIQHGIGAKNAAAFDVLMACASSIPGIVVAAQMISTQQYKCILITGSCHLTQISDPTDPSSFVVLGDGAGAAIMVPTTEDAGILAFDIQTSGEYFNYCGSRISKPKNLVGNKSDYCAPSQEKLYFYIENAENTASGVGKYLLTSVPATVKKALKKANLSIKEIDMFISHQNITPLVGSWVRMLGIPEEKTHLTYSKYGNMSAANIFINLDEALREGKVNNGDTIVFAGQGAGFSVGSIVMRW